MRRLSLSTKVIAVLFAAAALQGGVLARNYALRPQPVEVGDRFPEVPLEHAGVPVSMNLARLPDCSHVVFVIPTCEMCRKLAPRWATEFRDPESPRTVVVSLSGYKPAREYLDRSGLGRLPLFATGAESASSTGIKMGVLTIPTIAVVRDGQVAALGVGPDYTMEGLARQAQCPVPPRPALLQPR
jgi:hypothetical protein